MASSQAALLVTSMRWMSIALHTPACLRFKKPVILMMKSATGLGNAMRIAETPSHEARQRRMPRDGEQEMEQESPKQSSEQAASGG